MMQKNVDDFVSVEHGNVAVWTADGHQLTAFMCERASQADLAVEAIKTALSTYDGWEKT